jgi:hypothetical protein
MRSDFESDLKFSMVGVSVVCVVMVPAPRRKAKILSTILCLHLPLTLLAVDRRAAE